MKRRYSTIKGEKKSMVQKIRDARGFAFSGTVVSASAPRRGAIQVPKVKGGKRTMNRTGIKKMLTTTVLAVMAVLLVFSASAVCDTVDVDIKPGSDENPVNVKSNGVVSVAVLGNDSFDVMNINLTTILLNDTCAPIHWSYEDVDGDGYEDLVLKFETQDVVGCLPDPCNDEDIVTLTLTGELGDGTPITGSDDVRVLIKGKGK
jgi:hypothetical protein